MSPLFFAFLASLSIIAVSLIGVITLSRFAREKTERALPYLVSASAGLFIVVVATLFIEALEFLPLVTTLGLMALGFGILIALSWLLPESHHHHIDEECEEPGPKKPHARRILIADAIHNIGDGIILVPAFIVSPALGIAVTVSVLAHEAVQELSEFFVLRAAGHTAKRALLYNFLTACTILIGVGVGVVLAAFETITAGLLAVSAGAFLYVVFKDLIPHSVAHSKTHSKAGPHIVAAVVGVVVMGGIALAAPHQHAHDDDHDHSHGHGHTHDEHSHDGEEHHDDHDNHHDDEHGHEDDDHAHGAHTHSDEHDDDRHNNDHGHHEDDDDHHHD